MGDVRRITRLGGGEVRAAAAAAVLLKYRNVALGSSNRRSSVAAALPSFSHSKSAKYSQSAPTLITTTTRMMMQVIYGLQFRTLRRLLINVKVAPCSHLGNGNNKNACSSSGDGGGVQDHWKFPRRLEYKERNCAAG